jgi:hypothetical protein
VEQSIEYRMGAMETRMLNIESAVEAGAEVDRRVTKYLDVQEDREVQEEKHKSVMSSRVNYLMALVALLGLLIAWNTYDRQFNEPVRLQDYANRAATLATSQPTYTTRESGTTTTDQNGNQTFSTTDSNSTQTTQPAKAATK